MRVLVALAAAGGAALTVGATLLTTDEPPEATPAARRGPPPLVLDLGVRVDREAAALRRAEGLYDRRRRSAAAVIFGEYSSVEAKLGSAMAAWPQGTIQRLRALAVEHPRSALVRLHLGFALFASQRDEEAIRQWRVARRVAPDTLSAVRAGDLLHPQYARGLPVFVTSAGPPRRLASLPPHRQFAELRRAARDGDVRARLNYGVALQRLGRPLSARRVFDASVRLHPQNVEAHVAAAVARFDKERPARAFGRLGPLTRRFPRAATVRFHLGLLLLWIGRLDEARSQFVRATSIQPSSPLAREARRYLERLEGVGTR
jgi:tetratricopeptide (TPR) repeat protein